MDIHDELATSVFHWVCYDLTRSTHSKKSCTHLGVCNTEIVVTYTACLYAIASDARYFQVSEWHARKHVVWRGLIHGKVGTTSFLQERGRKQAR